MGAQAVQPLHVVKNLFRHHKTRYRGLAKNTHQWQALFTLSNLYQVRRTILATGET